MVLLPFIVLAAPAKAELAATILIEAPVVYAFSLILRTDAVRLVIASGFVNALTQPLLYLALRHFGSADRWWANFLFLEAVVWIAEALLYHVACTVACTVGCTVGFWRADRRTGKLFAISLAANAASALIGLGLPI
ncbi:MAG TPA: hypothetical protein VGF77_17210 [Allosphingosinicella sp.]